MAFTQISSTNIQPNTVVDYATYSTFTTSLAPKIASVNVANSAFTVLDDTAVNVGGGYIVVTGENFATNVTVLVDTTQASAVTRVSSTQLRVQVPSKSAATYNLYVVNPDGGTGIRVNGVTYSSDPTWVTTSPLSSQVSAIAFNLTFNATSATSYAVAAGSTLPTGTSLLANGYFSGTITNAVETTYSFSVVATDAENQDSSKTFQVTVAMPAVRLYSWGRNTGGSLGLGIGAMAAGSRSSPVQVGTDTNWDMISVREYSVAAIKNNGTLWAWGGYNNYGQLGQNDRILRSSPTQIGSNTNWSKVAAATGVTFAIKTNGTLWSWGNGYQGETGQGDTVARSSPTQVGSGTDWSEVSADSTTAMATKTNGTLYMWGQNTSGNLGLNGDSAYKSSPVQVAGTTWSKIFAGGYITLATKTDGTLWLWGGGYYGALGFNNLNDKSSPTQLGTDTNWSQITNGLGATLAIKTNGTLWAWGRNNKGQLGLNTVYTSNRSSPVQVGSGTTWSQINTRNGVVLAIKTDGTLWSWGDSNSGALGNNVSSYNYRSSPIQVGSGTTWSKVATSNFMSFAFTQG
jgi:alpha-tubulin suppressor-like RCC1 family protein